MRYLLVAFTWTTIVPMPRGGRTAVDRAAGGRVIGWVPAVGCVVGGAVAAIAWIGAVAGLPELLVGALAVGGAGLISRGMHLDGFADCVDGLGCYGPPERARAIMREGTVGPFGAAALALLLIAEVAAVGALADRGQWVAIGIAVAASRVSAVFACRRGWVAANPDGFGALTAGTQGWATVALWTATAVIAAVWAVPGVPWQGPLAVLVALAVAAAAARHCVRRFGGISGDVLGFGIEIATAVALLGLCAG